MAALAPLNTPARQPFGILNDSKLRSLQSVKNRQNAITPHSVPNLKRRAPSPGLSDSENVDPNILDTHGKRKRTSNDEDVSLSKPSRYSLHIVPSAKPYAPIATPTVTPRLDTITKPTSTPMSAPPAAGRSPTRGKRLGLMQSRKRFAPPSYGTKSPSLSITAALNGTLARRKAKKQRTIEESKPKSWFFDIFEESDEQQDYRMNEWTMTQSATGLDISDDEGKMQEQNDKGKENVDPNELFTAPVTRSAAAAQAAAPAKASRKDVMLDEPRTPLGDLNPAEFYAEGLDATSVVLVHEDAEPQPEQTEQPGSNEQEEEPRTDEFTFGAPEQLPSEAIVIHEDIHTMLANSTPVWDAQQPDESFTTDSDFTQGDSGAIEIWESESAKDEEEQVDVKFDEAEACALQEL